MTFQCTVPNNAVQALMQHGDRADVAKTIFAIILCT